MGLVVELNCILSSGMEYHVQRIQRKYLSIWISGILVVICVLRPSALGLELGTDAGGGGRIEVQLADHELVDWVPLSGRSR